MVYKFLDIPRYIAPEVYENTVDKIVEFLKREDAISAIYRLGNVNHPGISDLDIIAVFKNGSTCKLRPDDFFNTDDKYLVTHDLAGASIDYFNKTGQYTFCDNLKCIWGEEVEVAISEDDKQTKKRGLYKEQIGLEFLLKNYIDLTVQRKYGVIKLRSLLQEIKGVRYDLAFLGIEDLAINEEMSNFLKRLDHWFDVSFDAQEFSRWIDQYYMAIKAAIAHVNKQGKTLWTPREDELKYGRNIFLRRGDTLKSKTSGIFLPSAAISRKKKWYNAHQRLNKFEMELNFTTNDPGGIYLERLEALKAYKSHNEQHYPYFGALMSGLADHFI